MLEEKLLYPANYSIHGLDLFEEKLTWFKINTNFESKMGMQWEKKVRERWETQHEWSNCMPPRDGSPLGQPHLHQHPETGVELAARSTVPPEWAPASPQLHLCPQSWAFP